MKRNIYKLLVVSLVLAGSSNIGFAQDKKEVKKECKTACCSKENKEKKDHHMKMHEAKELDLKKFDKNNDGIVYQCPMKCEDPKDEAGECTKCGMKLKELKIMENEHKHHSKEEMHEHMNIDKQLSKFDLNKDGKIYQCPMKCEDPKDEPGDCAKCGMHLKEIKL